MEDKKKKVSLYFAYLRGRHGEAFKEIIENRLVSLYKKQMLMLSGDN